MKTTIEITLKSEGKPSIRHLGGDEYEISFDHTHCGGPGRLLWVRTWDPENLQRAKDGKGLLISYRRKITKG